MACPCETRTSTCRSFATISSGLYRFLAIAVLLDVKRHTSSRTTSMGADHRTKDDYKLFNCIRRYVLRHQQDPRSQHILQQGRQSQAQLKQNPDAVNLTLEARRACGR